MEIAYLGFILYFGQRQRILPSRPQIHTPPRAGPVKAGRVFRGQPKGLALIGPSTAACLIGSGLEAAGICAGTGACVTHSADEVSCRVFLAMYPCEMILRANTQQVLYRGRS
jgi:hypothetical protein